MREEGTHYGQMHKGKKKLTWAHCWDLHW